MNFILKLRKTLWSCRLRLILAQKPKTFDAVILDFRKRAGIRRV